MPTLTRDEWSKELPNSSRVNYVYWQLATDRAAANAKVEGRHVEFQRNNLPVGLTREQVEKLFEDDLHTA